VDWSVILGNRAPLPAVVNHPAHEDLAPLLSAFDELVGISDAHPMVRRSVDLARERIGVERVGVYLLDERHGKMLGTWGTDIRGNTVDEHHVMYDLGELDREVFRRAAVESAPFTVFDNCPIVDVRPDEIVVVGRGWVACTPIRSAHAETGMVFNDTGLTGAPVDEAKQARLAIFCSLLCTLLDVARERSDRGSPARDAMDDGEDLHASPRAIVRRAEGLLAEDPSLGGKEIAAKLDVSPSHLTRLFKADMGMSLVEYRNRLRLERFRALVDSGDESLLDAALDAGFGSYAQFHRVFRALRGTTPGAYVRKRGR
jgi:AraC-like DNA-binding protein